MIKQDGRIEELLVSFSSSLTWTRGLIMISLLWLCIPSTMVWFFMTCDEQTRVKVLAMTLAATGGEKTVLRSRLLLCLQIYQSHMLLHLPVPESCCRLVHDLTKCQFMYVRLLSLINRSHNAPIQPLMVAKSSSPRLRAISRVWTSLHNPRRLREILHRRMVGFFDVTWTYCNNHLIRFVLEWDMLACQERDNVKMVRAHPTMSRIHLVFVS